MLRLVFSAASTAVNKYNDVLSTMMELGSGEAFNRDDILQKTLATNKLSESTYKYMLAIGVTSTAEMTFGQKVKLSTMALWDQAKAWAATPMGMATIAAAGIFGLVKLVDWMTVSVEESREALAELGQEFKENESKITELNGELETTVDRITELEGKDSLTFTEAEELQNLKKQNNELEREIALLETIQRIKSQERNAAFVETMEKDLANAKEHLRSHDYSSSNYSAIYTDTKKYGKGRSVRTMSEMDLINSALMRRAEIIETLSGNLTKEERTKLESLQYEIDNYLTEKLTELNNDVDSSGVSYISNPTTEDEKAVNEWLSFIDDFNDKMMIAMGTTGAKENAVNRLILGDYAEVTKDLQALGEQGAVTADHLADPKYDDFINKCIELGIISDDGADSLSFLALAFNTVANSASGAAASVEDTASKLNGIMATMAEGSSGVSKRLSGAIGDLAGEDGKVYASTIKEIGEAIASYEDGHTGWTSEETAYNRLADAAKEYGLSVDELLTVLVDLGLVQDDSDSSADIYDDAITATKTRISALEDERKEILASNSALYEKVKAILAVGDAYNEIANGNVDYNKRPLITPEQVRKFYPEFDGEIATTYSQGITIGEGDYLPNSINQHLRRSCLAAHGATRSPNGWMENTSGCETL